MNHGIEEKYLKTIKNLVAKNSCNIQKVGLYGSRATGKYSKTSDIDLVIYGNISEQQQSRLFTCFLESMIPYKVDITAYSLITSKALKSHIDRLAKILFSHDELYFPVPTLEHENEVKFNSTNFPPRGCCRTQ